MEKEKKFKETTWITSFLLPFHCIASILFAVLVKCCAWSSNKTLQIHIIQFNSTDITVSFLLFFFRTRYLIKYDVRWRIVCTFINSNARCLCRQFHRLGTPKPQKPSEFCRVYITFYCFIPFSSFVLSWFVHCEVSIHFAAYFFSSFYV